jgi:hypothetical protein
MRLSTSRRKTHIACGYSGATLLQETLRPIQRKAVGQILARENDLRILRSPSGESNPLARRLFDVCVLLHTWRPSTITAMIQFLLLFAECSLCKQVRSFLFFCFGRSSAAMRGHTKVRWDFLRCTALGAFRLMATPGPNLIHSQRPHGLDRGGPTGWKVACKGSGDQEKQRNGRQGNEIGLFNAEEYALQQRS